MTAPAYPIMLDLRGWPCLVAGGGEVAARKIAGLLAAGAVVTVVSPTLGEGCAALVAAERVTHYPRPVAPADVQGMRLVIAATDASEVNAAVAAAAQAGGALVNVVDAPERGNFWLPAVVRRGDLTLTVATGTASPALARRLRQELETRYGPEWGTFIALLGALRPLILDRVADAGARRALFRALAASDIPTRLAHEPPAALAAPLQRLGLPLESVEIEALLAQLDRAEGGNERETEP